MREKYPSLYAPFLFGPQNRADNELQPESRDINPVKEVSREHAEAMDMLENVNMVGREDESEESDSEDFEDPPCVEYRVEDRDQWAVTSCSDGINANILLPNGDVKENQFTNQRRNEQQIFQTKMFELEMTFNQNRGKKMRKSYMTHFDEGNSLGRMRKNLASPIIQVHSGFNLRQLPSPKPRKKTFGNQLFFF